MGKQKQFRSEEARRNYEKSGKQRARAIRRKENQARRQGAKAWVMANKGKAAALLCALVAVIVLICAGVGALTDPLRGKQDSWLILDVSSGSEHQYRHLADFAVPAGYTRDDYSLYTDGVQQDFFCVATNDASPVQDVYVTGAKGITAADYPATILAYGLHMEAGEPRTLTLNGTECTALYLVSDESEWDGEGMAIAHMSFYFDTPYNACITATLRSATLPCEQLPDEATLLAEAEALLAGLTLVK